MGKLDGKVAVITGGAGSLGLAAGELLVKEGAKVALVDFDEQNLLFSKERLSAFGDILAIQADVSSERDVTGYVQQVLNQWGRIDVFLNNAGILGRVAQIPDQTEEDFNKIMNINVKGIFLGMKYVMPVMAGQKSGSIINTSSISGLSGSGGSSLYAASKHAVVGLTKSAALEAAADSVRVNSIHPAPLNSKMMQEIEENNKFQTPSEVRSRIASRIPLGRYGEMEEVAKLILFLASDDSRFITGSQYRIDGGMGAR